MSYDLEIYDKEVSNWQTKQQSTFSGLSLCMFSFARIF